jgi:branched-chain amino acid transport system substrate-binding protein
MGMRRRAAGIVLLLSLAGCARLNAVLGKVPTAVVPTWQIGIIGAAYGPGGLEGSYSGNGAQLAIDQINARGGIAWHGVHDLLAPIFSDAAAPADRVRDLVFRVPAPVALLGPDDSDAALAVVPLVAQTHIPMLTLATTPALTDPAQAPMPPQIFRVRPPLAAWARAVAQYAVQTGGPVVVATITNAYGRAGATAIATDLAAAQVTPAAQVALAPGLDDAAAPVAQSLAAHPTTILCWSTEAEAATYVHGLRAAGWTGQFVLGQVDPDFMALAGTDGNGAVGAMAWYPTLPTPASQAFTTAYVQRFGMQPDEHAAALYDAVQILAAGLAAVGPDRIALAQWLAHLNAFSGVTGTYSASAAATLGTVGDLTTTLHLVRLQDGQVSDISTGA